MNRLAALCLAAAALVAAAQTQPAADQARDDMERGANVTKLPVSATPTLVR